MSKPRNIPQHPSPAFLPVMRLSSQEYLPALPLPRDAWPAVRAQPTDGRVVRARQQMIAARPMCSRRFAAEIIDGGKDECEGWIASNGMRYRWS